MIWFREQSRSKPRFGPGWTSTTWTRVTLTPDGAQVREVDAALIDIA